MTDRTDKPESPERREILQKAGRFAAVTTPAVTFLLSTSLSSEAVAKSGGKPKKKRKGKKKGRRGRRRRLFH
ncbi:hypothetical protein [Leisingera sp.]|jgi:hypothetical protein|uniref:hypothetical protein n=1 Tax=Leisingera sp. TaxID=1879318 RepID=UPI002440C422